MYSRIIRGHLKAETRQEVSVNGLTLLRTPVHEERALKIQFSKTDRPKFLCMREESFVLT